MAKWVKTPWPGIRYREHPTRKHGVQKDRYYAIRYKVDGKDKEEALGWASQGWTPQKALERLAEIRQNLRTGTGPASLKEKRELAAVERAERDRLESSKVLFAVAADRYMAWCRTNKKDHEHDETRLRIHILPVLGGKLLADIGAADIEALKVSCQEKGMAPATVKHCLQIVRAVFNFSTRMGIFHGANPTKNIRFPKVDNKRVNFFTYQQAEQLLLALQPLDRDAHDMALFGLFTGARFSEIARLAWENVDLEHSIAHILDAKSGESRTAYLSERVREMLEARGRTHRLVFPSSVGRPYKDISDSFMKAVEALGYNDGVEDRRQRLTFHSCRHSFGSWLALQGEPLVAIQQLMGHKTITMTLRYAHLMPDTKRTAVEKLGQRVGAKVIPFRSAIGE